MKTIKIFNFLSVAMSGLKTIFRLYLGSTEILSYDAANGDADDDDGNGDWKAVDDVGGPVAGIVVVAMMMMMMLLATVVMVVVVVHVQVLVLVLLMGLQQQVAR